MPSPQPSDLWASVYRELRELARRFLASERPDHTLQPTALVHEAFLRLQADRKASQDGRAEFCRAAAAAMRRILVDHARGHLRRKRTGGARRLELTLDLEAAPLDAQRLLDVEGALEQLESVSPRRAEICRLRFFAGLTEDEIAAVQGVCRRTVQSEYRGARAWLGRALAGHQPGTPAAEAAGG